ncbi:MAG TPA: phosphoglycerate kinase, partial [Prolixibacteraceae bacterium]|nr:phosphoglycerate kinase [Prolixibacteraceae bacterium]
MQTIHSYDFTGKKALIRVDFNVPLDENFVITDDTRIRAALPTIRKVMTGGGSPVIMSHFGRPKAGPEDKFSMRHLVGHLSALVGVEVKLAPDCIGEEVKEMCLALKPGEVLLLENLRFHKGEEKGDVEFARQLADNGDCWINDAFGTAHRAHASTAVMAQFFPEDKMFGYLIESELESLDKVLKSPQRPLTAIMGGGSVQEAMDMSLIAQAATLESRIPFIHFFDGFRTSHEVNTVDIISHAQIREMIDDKLVDEHRKRGLNPDKPFIRGTAQNPDVYFQGRETVNAFYDKTPAIVQKTMDKFAKITGRAYKLFDYVGAPDAERVVIVMGS